MHRRRLSDITDALPTLVQVMKATGELLATKFREATTAEFKDPRNIQTVADLAAEGMIMGALEELFPEDSVFGEERGLLERDSGRVWFVDGLDGTTNFVAGIPLFASQVAYVVGGDITAAIVYVPATDECFTAVRGHGAQCNGITIHVQEPPNQDVRHAVAILSRAAIEEEVRRHAEIYPCMAQAVRTLRVVNSVAGDSVRVAKGRTHASIHNGARLHDVLGGILIVQEAGGAVTDFTGRPLTLPRVTDKPSLQALMDLRVDVLACCPGIHRCLVETLTPFARRQTEAVL